MEFVKEFNQEGDHVISQCYVKVKSMASRAANILSTWNLASTINIMCETWTANSTSVGWYDQRQCQALETFSLN